ncbi:nitrite reductase small subunit NirD [Niabella soli]|uniref:Nitrite reductase n=1 Tax=Niabella soli DSM 19437 TaxID=929713 RepID=W0F4C2_9BACT|nr:nitrite reductase small subunit NirD [Niabella soli]AHF16309.1 nitrite reductase [Niabella soli DSM 19437]
MTENSWIYACNVTDMPHNGGVCIQHGTEQIALYYFTHRDEWYATQNLCPHRQQMALSRGMLGSGQGQPKIACPFHKKTFSLIDGHCMNDDACAAIKIYPVKIQNGAVFINATPVLSSSTITHEQEKI